jgi:hypothetical protein
MGYPIALEYRFDTHLISDSFLISSGRLSL